MSCCGEQPEVLNTDATLRSMINVLRTRRNALRGGDGFGQVGTTIGAYKRVIARMEELIALVETISLEQNRPSEPISKNCPACGKLNCPYDWRSVFAVLRQKLVS